MTCPRRPSASPARGSATSRDTPGGRAKVRSRAMSVIEPQPATLRTSIEAGYDKRLMLESAGVDRVLTMDLHSGQIQGFFQKPCDHMTALFILTQYIQDLGLDDLVVVAPDVGRVKLAEKFRDKIGADLAVLTKERPAQQVAEISYIIGDVEGKTAV